MAVDPTKLTPEARFLELQVLVYQHARQIDVLETQLKEEHQNQLATGLILGVAIRFIEPLIGPEKAASMWKEIEQKAPAKSKQ